MFFSRESWSHSGPVTWSKLLIDDPLVKKTGREGGLITRLGELYGALSRFTGVAKREDENERVRRPGGLKSAWDSRTAGVLGNEGTFEAMDRSRKEPVSSAMESAAN